MADETTDKNKNKVVDFADKALKKARKGKKPPNGQPPSDDMRLIRKRGEIVACMANVYQILKHRPEWDGVLAFNEFSQRTMKLKPPPYALGDVGEWDATDESRTAIWMAQTMDFTPSSAMVREAAEARAQDNKFHPVREWLQSLPVWDRTPRLTEWISDFMGAPKTEYTQLVGRYFLIGMIARVMRPGVKFDYCLVLEGTQGKGKSSALAVLGGEWYGDTDLDLHSKDSMSAIRGKWLYEFAELGALSRAESTRQKSFLSRQVDEFRPAYGTREIRCPRQVCFGGTTNEWEWNKDPTGGRRFWPVECVGDIDVDGLRAARDQLFAEAYEAYQSGEQFWPTPELQRVLFDPEQLKREQQDSLVDALHDWVYEQRQEFTMADAVLEGLKLDASKLTRDMQTRVGIALRKLGCRKEDRKNGMVRFVYLPPPKPAKPKPPRISKDEDVPFG